MKLAAIYNVWDGVELLKHSIASIKQDVDLIIIVYQDISNFGEEFNPLPEIKKAVYGIPHVLHKYVPTVGNGFVNETTKRQIGIEIAYNYNCTHFLNLDCDEIYENFAKAKNLYIKSGAQGSVCKLFTYFKFPTLRFETEDGYFVPFIHELKSTTTAGSSVGYPFYCDPTRSINCNDVVCLPVHMHHFSWVRQNIERKCRNSSAKANIENGTMLQSYYDPNCGPGFYVKDADKYLIEVPNQFNINL
jgi:hypothetical protein